MFGSRGLGVGEGWIKMGASTDDPALRCDFPSSHSCCHAVRHGMICCPSVFGNPRGGKDGGRGGQNLLTRTFVSPTRLSQIQN